MVTRRICVPTWTGSVALLLARGRVIQDRDQDRELGRSILILVLSHTRLGPRLRTHIRLIMAHMDLTLQRMQRHTRITPHCLSTRGIAL
jgi:hypothetical protein